MLRTDNYYRPQLSGTLHVVSLNDRCNLYTTPGLTKYLFREAKIAQNFNSLRKAKNIQMTIPFMYNFRSLNLINSLRFSEVSFFPFHSPGQVIFVEKGNLKFSESKMQCRKESEKLSPSENFKLQLRCIIFGKIILKPLLF